MKTHLTPLAKKLRREATDAERRLWAHLRAKQLNGKKFRRQQPIGNYIVDFICFEKKLIIEVDGGQHMKNEHYDNQRTEWLQEEGFKVLRFWNHEVLENTDGVLQVILEACGPPVGAASKVYLMSP